jgi:hypothetical protein
MKMVKEEDLYDQRERAGGTAVFGDSMFFDDVKSKVDPEYGNKLFTQRAEECAQLITIHRDGSKSTEFIPCHTRGRVNMLPEDIKLIKKWAGEHSTHNK